MSEWIDTFAEMSDYEFMRLYGAAYWQPERKAAADQGSTTHHPYPGAPTGWAAKIQAERERRGLVWPESWDAAGIDVDRT